jgi:hypothetical protein
VREQIAARFGYDIQAIGRDAHQRELTSGREVVRRPPRRPAPPAATKRPREAASVSERP